MKINLMRSFGVVGVALLTIAAGTWLVYTVMGATISDGAQVLIVGAGLVGAVLLIGSAAVILLRKD